VDIFFKSSRLAKVLNEETLLKKTYGRENADRIRRRLVVLGAAASLADVPTVRPVRCHRLVGERGGCFAVDVLQPFRIVFEPDTDHLPRTAGARINIAKVTAIMILEIVDYH
jgi:proteic killer suppression protein